MLFAHPGEREAGFGEGLPQRLLLAAVRGAVDSLRIGEVRKNPRRGLGDDITALTHDASLSPRA